MVDRERPRQRDEALQIGEGERDPVGIEPAGRRDAAAEAAHDLFVEQRQQGAAEPLEDDKAQRVGADIDDGDAADRIARVPVGHQRWRICGRRITARPAAAGPRRNALPRPERLGLVMK